MKDTRDFLPFALPDIQDEEINAVVEVLKSGWITTGIKTKEFETLFAEFIENNDNRDLSANNYIKNHKIEAIAVNSATSGLHLALEACGVGRDDEVITTTLTFTATAETICYLGAHPIFVDIDKETLNMDINQIEQKITPKTKAIVPVHMAGLPCDMEQIIKIARKYNLKVIEDAAHALPSMLNNTLIGNHDSDAIVYSFYATKTITTGEGGMIVTRNKEIANRCRIMRLHGINKDAFDRYTSNKPSWYYEVVAPGFKYNLTDMASAIGICQLKKAYAFYNRRLEIAQRYFEELKNLPILLPKDVVNPNADIHSWHLFIIQLQTHTNRDEFIKYMSDNKIGTSVHFIPLHMQPYWKNRYHLKNEDYKTATAYYQQAVSIPIYTKMTNDDQSYIINTIKSFYTLGL